ncbi:Abi family protein [Corynebacterium uropygiale]|uniref:Abi family protein n=1 Tax=Corynebacterium uropygiale TaxID=1775911 RepID=A0A9X1TXI9_9CORY|nr:Abi family protein [Corynebacterium uropygiale]MCF4006140.1 Abi family protein [Corynebacterium uropygiale]
MAQLDQWFSSARMSTYSFHPDPEALYVWNTRITKAFLEDIQHIEVLLRNRMDDALTSRCTMKNGSETVSWFSNEKLALSKKNGEQLNRAIRKVEDKCGVSTHGKVIAELPFDFWYYLLSKSYSTTVWPCFHKLLRVESAKRVKGGLQRIPVPDRQQFKKQVGIIYTLRNRCSHHEPIVKDNFKKESSSLDRKQMAIEKVANWLDPDAADWILKNSRVNLVRAQRP